MVDSGLGKVKWNKTKIGDLFTFKNGLNKEKKYFGKGIPIINYMDVFNFEGLKKENIKGLVDLTPSEIERFNARKGDVFFTRTSETIEEIGISTVLLEDIEDCVFSGFILRARPTNTKLDNQFKKYCFSSYAVRKQIISRGTISTRALTNGPALSSVSLSLPPLPEQKKIADILSTVDEAIQNTKAQIEKTKELKRGLMQKLFSEGIGHTEFKDSKLGRIPKEWEVVRLKDVCGFITKGSTPTTYGFDWVESGVPFLRSECVGKNGFTEKGMMYISEEANQKLKRSKVLMNDILMTITGNVGRVCFYPFDAGNINQHIAIIRISSPNANNSFALQYLSQKKVRDYYMRIITGAAYPQISLKQVRETNLPLPSIDEQAKIAEVLGNADSKLSVIEDRLNGLKFLKKGLMQKLLTGEVRVKI